jgi:hypothetical protein
MGVMWSQDSEYAKERRKWETTHTEFGPPGRAATFTEYPLMIYRAKRSATGGPPILEHHIVENELDERNMRSRGFVRGPDHAVEMLDQQERELATAAAERAYHDKRLSAQAQAEAAAVDESTIHHIGDMPETPIHKKGWPKGKPRKQVIRE